MMTTTSWGTSWRGTFQNLSRQLFSEDFSDELGGEPLESKQPLTEVSAPLPLVQKEYTTEELQEKMKYLMTSQPQLWAEYKEELFREKAPTDPEIVRRVLIDFLSRHDDGASMAKAGQNALKVPGLPFGNTSNQQLPCNPPTWKPASAPARRRPRNASSMVNNLRDSLHRSLHTEELSTPIATKSSHLPPLSPSRRLPPRRGSVPLRQSFSNSVKGRSLEQQGSEHSASSASFHDDEEDVTVVSKATVAKASKVLPMDHTQRQLMRLQKVPHLWMMYQSERLHAQTMVESPDGGKGSEEKQEGSSNAKENQPHVPTADHSSVKEFWKKHEVAILDYEAEEEQARMAALEEARRRKAASRIQIELNVSFHEEASKRHPPRNYFTISDHEASGKPNKDDMGSSHQQAATLNQDPVQQKLARVKQVPDLWQRFQSQLDKEDNPRHVETIKKTIDDFWLEHEQQVANHERRSNSMLNISFHEESLPPPSPRRPLPPTSTSNRGMFSLESARQSFSSRSMSSIHMAVNDLTEELSPLKEKKESIAFENKKKPEAGLDRRAKMMEMYKKGENFSSRSMRSVRIAIDGLAREVDGSMQTEAKEDTTPHRMGTGVKPVVESSPRSTPSAGGWFEKWSQVSALLTQDLESEVLPNTIQGTGSAVTEDTKDESLDDDEDEDDLFVRAAEIATARRKPTMEDVIEEENETTENDNDDEKEEEECPMAKIFRDPMMEVTMHKDILDDENTQEKQGNERPTTGETNVEIDSLSWGACHTLYGEKD